MDYEMFKKCEECDQWGNPSKENSKFCRICIKVRTKCDECHEWEKPSKVISQICQLCIWKYGKCNCCNEWRKPSEENPHICQICMMYGECKNCHKLRNLSKENPHICHNCQKYIKICDKCNNLFETYSKKNQQICQLCIRKYVKCIDCNEWRKPSKKNPQICQKCIICKIKCNGCYKWRKPFEKDTQICRICYKLFNSSGNQDIDDFIKYTQINCNQTVRMEFFPYYQFKNVEYIAEGGFSIIYKATFENGKLENGKINFGRIRSLNVALKKLNNSNNITSKELNELKIFYKLNLNCGLYSSFHINEYYGITRDPNTGNIMFIMKYYESGDLSDYIAKNFYNIDWIKKLEILDNIIGGLYHIHDQKFIHRDLHSGNILYSNNKSKHPAVISDLGISKSSTESTDKEHIYGIIPYISPEIFLGQKYTTAADIYSFGMIMWELMTGRKPFWDQRHNIELIIEIVDGCRPPIVTNAPEGFIELMQKCWDSDPNKRPAASDLKIKLNVMKHNEYENVTECNKQTNMIGPITTNNQKAIYKSRSLSEMIKSAMLIRNSRSQIINSELGKRKLDDDYKSFKRSKLFENKNNGLYVPKELELDTNEDYITKALAYDI